MLIKLLVSYSAFFWEDCQPLQKVQYIFIFFMIFVFYPKRKKKRKWSDLLIMKSFFFKTKSDFFELTVSYVQTKLLCSKTCRTSKKVMFDFEKWSLYLCVWLWFPFCHHYIKSSLCNHKWIIPWLQHVIQYFYQNLMCTIFARTMHYNREREYYRNCWNKKVSISITEYIRDKANLKGCRIGHSVKVSLWCVTLLINTRFHFFILE